MSDLLEENAKFNRREIKDARKRMETCLELVMDVLTNFSDFYTKYGEHQKCRRILSEMEQIEADFYSATESAQECLDRHKDDSSSVNSETFTIDLQRRLNIAAENSETQAKEHTPRTFDQVHFSEQSSNINSFVPVTNGHDQSRYAAMSSRTTLTDVYDLGSNQNIDTIAREPGRTTVYPTTVYPTQAQNIDTIVREPGRTNMHPTQDRNIDAIVREPGRPIVYPIQEQKIDPIVREPGRQPVYPTQEDADYLNATRKIHQEDTEYYGDSRTRMNTRAASFVPRSYSYKETPIPTDSREIPSIGQDLWRQLKRVQIPVFSGDKRNYASWRAAFLACIDSAPATGEYKLLQLRQYLSGEALKTIENLGHSSSAYEAAKERLDRKFGGMRRQIALYLEDRQLQTSSPGEF